METPWTVLNLWMGLVLFQLCNGFPINLENTTVDSHTQLLTGLVAILLTVCSVVFLAGCLCCQRRNGFKEFRDSPVVASTASNLDHGHINPVANGEFTIFTPLSPPHQNNNVFLANQQIIVRTPEDYSYGDVDVSSWFNGTEKDFPRIKLKYIREIGKGWFGRVVEGAAQDINNEQKWTPVAVRILEATASSRERVVFLHDAAIYRCGKHPNILQLFGRCLDTVPLLLLQEFCPQGDLKKYLRENQSTAETLLSTEYPLLWCCQLTSALKHLHDNKLTHPDLAARNCQLTQNLTLKLGDYGLTVFQYPDDYYQGAPGVPVRWLSPESIQYTQTTIQPKKITPECNIWSLAVTMWEVCECGKQPYCNLSDDEVITQVLGGSSVRLGRPSHPVLYTDYMFRLMQLCWTSSESRPAVAQIDLMLTDLLQVHKNTNNQEVSVEDFDRRWESLKPNTIVKTDNQIDCSDNDSEIIPTKQLSPSLNNLHGSLDNLLDNNPMESWLENVATKTGDLSYVKGLSDAIKDLDQTLALENASSSDSSPVELKSKPKLEFKLGPLRSKTEVDDFMQRNSSGSETEEENWKRKIERGAYSEKVRQKSRSVADLMVLTHIDYSESESETPLPSLDYRINNYKNVRYAPKNNLDVSLTFGSEGNLLNVQDTFQEELKKLQEERKDSLLFVPEKRSQNNQTNNVECSSNTHVPTSSWDDSPSKRLLHELNSPTDIKPANQVFNVFNVVTIDKYSPVHTKLNHIINIDHSHDLDRDVDDDNDDNSPCQVPKLSDIIKNNSRIVHFLTSELVGDGHVQQQQLNGFHEDNFYDQEHIIRTVPKLVDIIQNNDELMDYIIANYDDDDDLQLEKNEDVTIERSAEDLNGLAELTKRSTDFGDTGRSSENEDNLEKENKKLDTEQNEYIRLNVPEKPCSGGENLKKFVEEPVGSPENEVVGEQTGKREMDFVQNGKTEDCKESLKQALNLLEHKKVQDPEQFLEEVVNCKEPQDSVEEIRRFHAEDNGDVEKQGHNEFLIVEEETEKGCLGVENRKEKESGTDDLVEVVIFKTQQFLEQEVQNYGLKVKGIQGESSMEKPRCGLPQAESQNQMKELASKTQQFLELEVQNYVLEASKVQSARNQIKEYLEELIDQSVEIVKEKQSLKNDMSEVQNGTPEIKTDKLALQCERLDANEECDEQSSPETEEYQLEDIERELGELCEDSTPRPQFLDYEIHNYPVQEQTSIEVLAETPVIERTKTFVENEIQNYDALAVVNEINYSPIVTCQNSGSGMIELGENNSTSRGFELSIPREVLDEILNKCLEIVVDDDNNFDSINLLDGTPEIAFDLSENQEEAMPNSLTHSSVFTSTPFGKRSIQERDDYSSLNLFVGDQDETPEVDDNNRNLYSLETWDKYLGKVLENQDKDGLFDSFSSEPQSLLFIENANQTYDLDKKINGDGDEVTETNCTFTIDGKHENDEIDKNGTFVIDEVGEKLAEGTETGVWEKNSGWFLHPQSSSDEISGEMTVSESTKTDSYVGFNMDDEIMAAIRNELLTKLPQAQGVSNEKIQDEDELELLERNEVFLRYNVYNTPLSPIPEESLFDDEHTKQQDDDDSDWSEPCDDEKPPQDTTLESPRRQHRHTPSQDSCCSNDTLFNLEELINNEPERETNSPALKKEDSIESVNQEPNSESVQCCDSGVIVVVDRLDTGYITDFLNSERANMKLQEESETESLLPFIDNKQVAPLPSPEDKPWKQLPASLLSYDKISLQSTTTNDASEPHDYVNAPDYEIINNDDIEKKEEEEEEKVDDYETVTDINDIYNEADYVNIVNLENTKNSRDDDSSNMKSPDYVNSLIIDDEHDVYGVLTDIRFSGPGDSQLMSTSFSESNDLNDEQDWDSGSDTRSSSSGEFIWKEGEHEESLKALRAAPQDVMDDIKPMEEIQEETTSESSGSDEEGESPEFVPSAWDKYATPTKSALRSPEKIIEKADKKKSKGVWFKKQKYHCVYEYPREPESPIPSTYDLWGPRQDYSTFADWDLDATDTFTPTNEASSDDDFTYQYPKAKRNLNLYQLSNVDFSSSSGLDDEFFISSSAKPFDMMGVGLSSQFFPGATQWSNILKGGDNITPDSGVEDITPADYQQAPPLRTVQSLKTLASNVVKKNSKKVEETTMTTMGGLRHTRNKLKLDLPPSPSAFTSSKMFNIEPIIDPVVNREKPTFTTFGKSRFLVQHVDTPPDSDDGKNVSFEALPYKPLQQKQQVYIKDYELKDKKGKVEIVRGEASLLDSADEDSGIESSTLERKMIKID